MGQMRQFHNPQLSIWQSAVEEVVAKKTAGVETQALGGTPVIGERPDSDDFMIREANSYCAAVNRGAPIKTTPAGAVVTEGLGTTLINCSLSGLKLAKSIILGEKQDAEQLKVEFEKFGGCNPGYAEAAALYAAYFIAQGKKIPYRVYKNLGDFVIDGKLPDNANVAILADWGTGQDTAKALLKQIADKKPDVVIHLGDVYYSGTQFEIQNYFSNPLTQILNPAARQIPVFTLAGNHDMYCGGAPYYSLIDKLGQPASYFCLRNDNWQFLAMDTGVHDFNPGAAGEGATYLEDTEVTWLKDKMDNAGNRRTVLLSHHQLFTAFDAIDNQEVNMRFYAQVSSFLPQAALWLWGHEHNFVLYGPFKKLQRARCIGHAAFPVSIADVPANPKFSDVPLITKDSAGQPIKLGVTGELYNHGYAMMKLNGPTATVSYYQDSDPDHPMFTETIP